MADNTCGCCRKNCPLGHKDRCSNQGTHVYTVKDGSETVDALLCEPCGDPILEEQS